MITNADGAQTDILFTTEDKTWCLCNMFWTHSAPPSLTATHLACKQPNAAPVGASRDSSWFMDEKPECWSCMCPVPEEIQALFKLIEYGNGNLGKYDE